MDAVVTPAYCHLVIRIDRELKISWTCPHCHKKQVGFYNVPVLACDMGRASIQCKKCKKEVLVNPKHDKTIYI